MPIIKDNQIVEDHWLRLVDEDEIPETGNILLSLEHALDYITFGAQHNGRLGVRLNPDDEVEKLIPLLAQLDLIKLQFPSFTDGRAYSQATQLRQQLAFKGELRACGNVLVDQLQMMNRCGIDSFEITDRRHFRVWQAKFSDQDLSLAYQRRAQPEGVRNIRARRLSPWLISD